MNTRPMPEIVTRALLHTVTSIGQLSPDEIKTLDLYVKRGWLSKGKGGTFPIAKTVYAHPGYDFDGNRVAAIQEMFAMCEALGEYVEWQ